MIRRMIAEDVPALIAEGRDFYEYTRYDNYIPFNDDDVGSFLIRVSDLDNHVVLVSESKGKIAGAIGGAVLPMYQNIKVPCLLEFLWWVAPEFHGYGHGIRLLEELQKWGTLNGAVMSLIAINVIGDRHIKSESMLRRLGYSIVEHRFARPLQSEGDETWVGPRH